jgi:Mrp family chromosome partitioning ATPase
MGKLLETLQRTAEAPGRQTPAPEPAAREEVPFIEVGGRGAPVDGSPDVLAALPSRAAAGPRLQQLRVPAADVRTVRFRPVSAGRSPVRFAPELVAYHCPEHPVSRQYQALAEALAEGLPAGGSPVLLFTAATAGVGTTTVLLNLAIALARRGERRVVVVDARPDRPAVAERLGLPAVPGFEDVLTGALPVAQALQETSQERLLALTAGRGRGRAGARRTGDSLRRVVRQLAEQDGLVLVDAPCWDGRPELRTLADLCDAVYLVSSGGGDAATAELLRSLPEDGVRLRGQILIGR